MDPIAMTPLRRRERDNIIDFCCCLFCQRKESCIKKNSGLGQGTAVGWKRIKEAVIERAKYNDVENIEVIDRLQETDLDEHITEVKWHASCYSSFTNSAHIKRLQNRLNSYKGSLEA